MEDMVLTEERTIEVEVGSASRVGGRESNQDAVLVARTGDGEHSWVLAVADGMGGHEGGEIASRLAVEVLEQRFTGSLSSDVALDLKRAYREANDRIWAEGGAESAGHMGTTLVAAIVRDGYLTIANVGDSRAYLLRGSQVLQVTQDHSLVAEQVKRGELEAGAERQSPQRNVLTAAVGTTERLDRKLPDIYELSLLPEDRLLLCSDGFHDVVEQKEYAAHLVGGDPSTLAMSLASLAEQRGTTDNVSAVVLITRPSRASEQRQQLESTIAEQRAQASPIVILVVLLVLVVALAAIAVLFLL
jgi:PPM family protein phosphatase